MRVVSLSQEQSLKGMTGMRVCIFARAVDGHTPGAYRWPFSILVERFAKQGIECLVLTTAREDGVETETIGPLVTIRYLPGTKPKKITSAYWRQSSAEFADAHARHSFDVILGRGDTAYGVLASMGKRAPVLINHEGSFPPEIMRAMISQRAVDRLLTPLVSLVRAVVKRQRNYCLGRSVEVVCLTGALAEAISSSAWWSTINTRVIPYGIDTDTYAPLPAVAAIAREKLQIQSGTPLLLYVGRVNRSKGAEDAIRVLARLRNNNAHLVYIGAVDPDYVVSLEDLAKDLGVANRISIVGPLPVDRLVPFYSAADLLLFASGHNEGLPKVIMEAMACGTPAIAYDLPGLSVVINNQVNGCLVPPGNIAEMATGINAFLDDPATQDKMGRAARDEIISTYTQQSIDALWLKLLEDVSRHAQSISDS